MKISIIRMSQIGSGMLCLLILAGCSSAPSMEFEAASSAINHMNELDAINYAADEAKQAQDAWNSAQRLMDEKKYSEAKPFLLKAKGRADTASRRAKSQRELMSQETESWRATIDWRYKSLKAAYAEKEAKFKPDQKKDMEALIKQVDEGVAELMKDIEAKRYYKTTTLGKKTMKVVYDGETLLREVAGDYTPKTPK